MAGPLGDFADREVPSSDPGKIPGFELISELGHGGMATVYRARDQQLGREVALKIIHPHLRANAEVCERFTREARAVARLKHPNICEVHCVSGPEEQERYLVVELVNGPSLRQLLGAVGAMPSEIAAAVGLELCDALGHAHQVGIIHRDVKPENVLVELPSSADCAAHIKLADFGIAKVLDTQGMTATGQVLGSPAHMAPEQVEGAPVDERTDVYAVGTLLFECMTGVLPVDGDSPAQVLRRILAGEFPAPDAVEPRVGGAWAAIVTRALARSPADRFASCAELSAALRAELQRLGFDEPAAELSAFLRDPETYRADYDSRMVEALVERGSGSEDRRSGVVDLQRALAFRPDDSQLMQRVHRAVRGTRQKRLIVSALGAGAVLVTVIAVAVTAATWMRSASPDEPSVVPAAEVLTVAPTARVTTSVPSQEARSVMSIAAREGEASAPTPTKPAREGRPTAVVPKAPKNVPARKTAAPTVKRRTHPVEVRIVGATGGGVKVDGTPVDWQGKVLHLSPGPHRFEFVPPTPDCCLSPPARSVVVKGPGPDGRPQLVTERISFRPAHLRLGELPAGTSVSCPGLLAQAIRAPRTARVPMRRPKHRAYCTVRAPNGESPAVTKPVTLRAGQTTTLVL